MRPHEHPAPRWEHTVAGLFAAQVRQRPDAVAVSCAAARLTYAELDARSDRVAHWLLRHGIGVESVVAVRLARGLDLVAALLGILKAGGAYLHVETDTPPSRTKETIAAAGASAMVTEDEGDDVGLPTLRLPSGLDAAWPDVAPPQVRPDNLAYLSFTSGSTGAPRCVGVPHRAVARLVLGDSARLGPDQVFLLLAPVSFDASTLEIWGALLNGGRLAVYPPGLVDAAELTQVLARERVTTLWLPSGLFHRMVDHHIDALGGLQQLLAGGDVLDPDRVNRFVARHPSVRLINGYGPTENTTFSSCNTISTLVRGYVSIGRPIAGTVLYVLDSALRPVRPGESGELYVAGAGLSRGYVTDAPATAAHFVPDPFAATPGSRMYRTGDLVRYVGDDDLEFLGRVDRQVKIRGFRVEPAEIERALASLPEVREAVLVAARDNGHPAYLVAYALPAHPDRTDAGQLVTQIRRGLRQLLPPYMIPSAFVPVAELPLNRNGKIDRSLLPLLDRVARDSDTTFVPATSPTEQLMCDLWAEALKLDRVGVLDDFFELGGHSLLAMDLISQAETVFGVELPIRMLLLHPTVREFAHAIDELLTPVGVEK